VRVSVIARDRRFQANSDGIERVISIMPGGSLGSGYCTSTANSTGAAAAIRAVGSDSLAAGSLALEASGLPNQPFVFFFGTSQTRLPLVIASCA